MNLARGHFRKLQVQRSYAERHGSVTHTAHLELPDVAQKDELWRALQRLPYRQKAAIVLRFYEDLSEQQTADLLSCPVGTVKSLVSRGLDAMKEHVSREEG